MNKPFLLRPSGKNYLWGGTRLNDEFAKGLDMNPLAETWECSTNSDCPSYAANGIFEGLSLDEILYLHPEYKGTKHPKDEKFPVLIKFIDARDNLSVQVHPGDAYAYQNEDMKLGKSEMWYVLDAKKDTTLYYGFAHDTDKTLVKSAIDDGTLVNHLRRVKVNKDDIFFIEPGTVHAIGTGALVAEIQENSDITYRLYDYNRKDKAGNKRKLSVGKALDVLNYNSSDIPRQPLRLLKYSQGVASELLCRCKYFEVYRMIVNTERRQLVRYQADESGFRVLLCVNGCGTVSFAHESFSFYKGDCIFVPAASEALTIHGQAQFLDVRG